VLEPARPSFSVTSSIGFFNPRVVIARQTLSPVRTSKFPEMCDPKKLAGIAETRS